MPGQNNSNKTEVCQPSDKYLMIQFSSLMKSTLMLGERLAKGIKGK